MLQTKILKDDLYETTIKVDYKNIYIMPDIFTAIKMTDLVNRLHTHVERLKQLNKEDLLKAEQIIINHKMYSNKEREYLLHHLKVIHSYL